jgi:hypothetical protein
MSSLATTNDDSHAFRVTLAVALLLTLVRIAVLVASPLELHPDEAQYWWWAQSPDFGYFSKPPMIAWIIWVTTTLFGNAEWAVRLAAPILHGATGLFVYGIARHALAPRQALLSGAAYLTTPGLSYSSGLISTDVPLLLLWAIALYAFLRALTDARWRWPVLCGVALGLGLEAKYAMLYFLAGAALSAIAIPEARRLVIGKRGIAILVIGSLLILPNLLWNAAHGFATVDHVATNADWAEARFSVVHAIGFIAGQFGVFGPILMFGYLAALWHRLKSPSGEIGGLTLLLFSLPPLAAIVVQAFISSANANWAATAYIAATPLAIGEIARWWRGRAIWVSFTINGLAMALLWIILVRPATADAIGIESAFKREEGWRDLGRVVANASRAAPYAAVVTDNRSVMAEMLYYARPRTVPLRIWDRDRRVKDHFQMTMPLLPGRARMLLVLDPIDTPRVLVTFDSARLVQDVVIALGSHHARHMALYEVHDYRGPQVERPRGDFSPEAVM